MGVDYWRDPVTHDQPVLGRPGMKRKVSDDDFVDMCREPSTLERIAELAGFYAGSPLRNRINALVAAGRLTKQVVTGETRRKVTVYQSVVTDDGEAIEAPPAPPSVLVSVSSWQGEERAYRIELMLEGRHDEEQRYYAYVSTTLPDGEEWAAMTKTMRSEDYTIEAARSLAAKHSGTTVAAAKRRRA